MTQRGTSRRGTVGEVHFVGSFPGRLPDPNLPEVAFVGRSNVGKSSAINTLLGRKKAARVSRTPGRTQAINLFVLDRQLSFADLPGYGFARVPPQVQERWRRSMERYLRERETLELVIVLVDARHPGQRSDVQMLDALRRFERKVLVVATKVDQVGRSRRARHLSRLSRDLGVPHKDIIGFSSLEKLGTDDVWGRILAVTDQAGERPAPGQ